MFAWAGGLGGDVFTVYMGLDGRGSGWGCFFRGDMLLMMSQNDAMKDFFAGDCAMFEVALCVRGMAVCAGGEGRIT